MKTSNYIIIAFLTFLFEGIFIFYLTSWQHPIDRYERTSSFNSYNEKLDNFSVIVAQPNSSIAISKLEYPQFTIVYPKSDSCTFSSYEVRNDTLFVSTDELTPKHTLNIYSSTLKSIVAKNKSIVNIHQYPFDSLHIESSSSRIFLDNINIKNAKSLLYINARSNSRIQLNNMDAGEINMKLSHSELSIQNSEIGTLSGNVMKESKLYSYKSVGKFNLEVDPTSKYNLNKQ
ncbi:hypothetical protein ACUNWD_16325 [Sunxiuqinia sp. A32]|uniref:hypothetical protein n=1 Tax=Sunxiuqinia sp. A32 TaxID=3461496 RepID=UPI0040458F08